MINLIKSCLGSYYNEALGRCFICVCKCHDERKNLRSKHIGRRRTIDFDQNRSDLDTIKEVKQEFRSHHQKLMVKHKEISTRPGKVFVRVVPKPKDVCEEIKNSLDEEIAEIIISKRDRI